VGDLARRTGAQGEEAALETPSICTMLDTSVCRGGVGSLTGGPANA